MKGTEAASREGQAATMDTNKQLFPVPHRPALGTASLGWSRDHDERQWWHLHAGGDWQATPAIRRPRVLVEMPNPVLAATVATLFEEEGYDVTHCGGPGHTPYGCPLARGLRCPIADQADIIVDGLGLVTPEGRAVWAGHEATHAGTPRVLVRGPGDPAVKAAPGRASIAGPLTRQGILEAVEHAAGRAG